MLTETLSGKCPCCGYDKLLQRYGSMGYHQLDGCPNCGFSYGSNHHDESEPIGSGVLIRYGAHMMACLEAEKYEHLCQDDPQVFRHEDGKGYTSHGGITKESKAYDMAFAELSKLDELTMRKKIFDWAESETRCDDVVGTIFTYDKKDVDDYLATNPVIFKKV